MPRYLDRHPTIPNMPAEAVQQLKQKLQAGDPDQFGVIGLNMFVGRDETWCYAEAPNAEAVHQAHESMGVKLGPGDVTEVQALV